MPGVLIVREAGTERRVTFDARAVVGRDPDCTLVLSSRSVSRRHAIVERTPDGWTVQDLASANGVFLDGKRVARANLAPGASLRFGDVETTFETDASGPTAKVERSSGPLSVAPTRRARPVAGVVTVALGVLALVAATLWARYCDRAPRPGAASSVPAAATAIRRSTRKRPSPAGARRRNSPP